MLKLKFGWQSKNVFSKRRIFVSLNRTYAEIARKSIDEIGKSDKHSGEKIEKEKKAYELYKEKLLEKARSEGLSSIEELKIKYSKKREEIKKELNKNDPLKILDEYKENFTKTKPLSPYKESNLNIPKQKIKKLSDIVDVTKLKDLDNTSIEYLWRLKHSKDEQNICAVLNDKTFAKLLLNARKFPMFLLPLPRSGQGVEIHFMQWSFPEKNIVHCMITTLQEYKMHTDFARPHTTLSFYSELLEQTPAKDIVLMEGYSDKSASISPQDAQFLVLALQKFYSADKLTVSGKRRLHLMELFKSGNPLFTVDSLLEEIERMD